MGMRSTDPRPLEPFSDGALLAELRDRGMLRELHVQQAISMVDLGLLNNVDGYLGYIREAMGRMLAVKIFESGIVREESKVDGLAMNKLFQMRLLVVTVPSSPTE